MTVALMIVNIIFAVMGMFFLQLVYGKVVVQKDIMSCLVKNIVAQKDIQGDII